MNRRAWDQDGISREEEAGESRFTEPLQNIQSGAAERNRCTKETGSPWSRKLGRTQRALLSSLTNRTEQGESGMAVGELGEAV